MRVASRFPFVMTMVMACIPAPLFACSPQRNPSATTGGGVQGLRPASGDPVKLSSARTVEYYPDREALAKKFQDQRKTLVPPPGYVLPGKVLEDRPDRVTSVVSTENRGQPTAWAATRVFVKDGFFVMLFANGVGGQVTGDYVMGNLDKMEEWSLRAFEKALPKIPEAVSQKGGS